MKRGLSSRILIGVIVVIVLVVIAVLGVGVAGCAKKAVDSSTTSTSEGATSTSTTADGTTGSTVPPATLTGPYVEPAYLDSQPVDLTAITNLDKVTLSEAQKQVLARQSFVADRAVTRERAHGSSGRSTRQPGIRDCRCWSPPTLCSMHITASSIPCFSGWKRRRFTTRRWP